MLFSLNTKDPLCLGKLKGAQNMITSCVLCLNLKSLADGKVGNK